MIRYLLTLALCALATGAHAGLEAIENPGPTGAPLVSGTTGQFSYLTVSSQPYVRAATGTGKLTNGVSTQMFYAAPESGDNVGSMYGGASSSGTFTVPTSHGGMYNISVNQFVGSTASVWIVDIKKNGSAISGCYREATANNKSLECETRILLASGDAITVFITQSTGSDVTPNTNAVYSYFTMDKVR